MKTKEELSDIWGKHAKRYSEKIYRSDEGIKNSQDPIICWFRNMKKREKLQLLDVGCGIGQYVSDTKKLGFNSKGIDISEEAVKISKEHNLNVSLGDMRKMPFKDNKFDVVIAGGSLEHFPETQKGINEISRVLKHGGIFLGNVPKRYSIFPLIKNIEKLLGIWKLGYEKSFSKRKFKKKLSNAGLKVIEIKRLRIMLGKHKFVGKILQILDEPFFLLGAGGAHFYFKAVKE